VKRLTAKVFFLALAPLLLVGYLLFTGPHMEHQQKMGPYQAAFPPSPKNSVPLKDPVPKLATTQEAEALASAVPPTEQNIAAAGVYYGYYCAFCHGPSGDGRGPVGESFVPPPADLRSAKVQSLSDGRLFRAMLRGEGHEPVLERVVPPEARPYLVLYVRRLAADAAQNK
jgi:mono/diheme cytochrome c family protein